MSSCQAVEACGKRRGGPARPRYLYIDGPHVKVFLGAINAKPPERSFDETKGREVKMEEPEEIDAVEATVCWSPPRVAKMVSLPVTLNDGCGFSRGW